MSSSARKLDIREANEARILRAAEKTFALHGFRGATTEAIASEAGLPKARGTMPKARATIKATWTVWRIIYKRCRIAPSYCAATNVCK